MGQGAFARLLEETVFVGSVTNNIYGFMGFLQPFLLVVVALPEVALVPFSINKLLMYTF